MHSARTALLAFFPPLLFLFLFAFLLPTEANAALIGRWKLDEGTGTTASDSSGNGYHGTWSGTSSGNTGYYDTRATTSFSYAGSFDGGDDQVLVTGINTVVKTVTFWAYIPNLDGTTEMVSKSTSGNGFEVIVHGGTINFYLMGSDVTPAVANSSDINVGAWNYITGTYNGGGTTMRIYINGTLSGSATAPASVNNIENLYFGTWGSGGRQFVGRLNDVRLYDVELTADQISNIMAGSLDPDSPPDSTAPTVGITVPSASGTVGGAAASLSATSTDSTSVSGVTFYYNTSNRIGSEITATSSANTYSTTWDTTGLSDGSYSLIAVARDPSGNRATSTTVSVTVDNTAPVISSVATSSPSSSGITTTWTTNEAGSTKVIYSVDTTYASSTSETDTSTRVTSHTKALTSLLSCTTYNFKTVSRDSVGNSATSSTASFSTTGCAGGATPSSATSSIVTVSGIATTSITDTSRTITVVSPANFTATSSSVVIQIKGLDASTVVSSLGKPSSSLSTAGAIAFNVTALIDNITELDSFDTPVTVSYTYTDADVSGLTESTLSMYHYADGSWSELDNCSLNTATNTVTCEAPHFSVFAVFATAPASTSSSETSSGAVLFTGSASSLPGYVAPKLQIFHTNGTTQLVMSNTAPQPVVTSSTTCPRPTFTKTLRLGSRGEDVRQLQKLMNCLGFTLGTTGPGSPGKETTIFADRTHNAVIRFQEAYATSILSPLSLSRGSGIFAELSRKKAAELVD